MEQRDRRTEKQREIEKMRYMKRLSLLFLLLLIGRYFVSLDQPVKIHLMGEGFKGGVHPPLRTFLISDFVL